MMHPGFHMVAAMVSHPRGGPMRNRGRWLTSAGWAVSMLIASQLVGCHEPAGLPPANEATEKVLPTPSPPNADEIPKPNPPPHVLPLDADDVILDPDAWLFVEKVESGQDGGWATGSFDVGRNKLIIQTRHVVRFSMSLDRVRIDWDRLVVLKLNGVNSELRKRENPLLRFERDKRSQWKVLEP